MAPTSLTAQAQVILPPHRALHALPITSPFSPPPTLPLAHPTLTILGHCFSQNTEAYSPLSAESLVHTSV